MNQKRLAKIKGISLLLMAVVAVFSIGYAYTTFDNSEQFEFLKDNIVQNQGLYYCMVLGILIIIILDFVVSYTLYKYFEEDHKNLSLVSGIIRATYTVIFRMENYCRQNLYAIPFGILCIAKMAAI